LDLYFLQVVLQIGFEGLNLEVVAGDALSMRFKISTAHGTTCFMRRSLPSSFNGVRRRGSLFNPYYYSIRGTAVCVYRFFSHFQATGLALMSHISLAY
jgi:hypothetical protein